jgi:hypothetical protein
MYINQAPGIFSAIIKELAAGTITSLVPVITSVGIDILGGSGS